MKLGPVCALWRQGCQGEGWAMCDRGQFHRFGEGVSTGHGGLRVSLPHGWSVLRARCLQVLGFRKLSGLEAFPSAWPNMSFCISTVEWEPEGDRC